MAIITVSNIAIADPYKEISFFIFWDEVIV